MDAGGLADLIGLGFGSWCIMEKVVGGPTGAAEGLCCWCWLSGKRREGAVFTGFNWGWQLWVELIAILMRDKGDEAVVA